jgi:hypothetical protein
MPEMTPEPIFQLATGFMAAKHLFIANEIGLFTALADGPVPLDRLAALTGIARPRVRILGFSAQPPKKYSSEFRSLDELRRDRDRATP